MVIKRQSKPCVLVTGGAGYVGSHAVLVLQDFGWPVAVLDNLTTGVRSAVPDDVPFYKGNVEDKDLLKRIFDEQMTGAIMHFAGSVIVTQSVKNPMAYYRNNTVSSHALIHAAVQAKIPHFIFSSTAAVYGSAPTANVDEDTPTVPINPYGWSKLMTEQMLKDASIANEINHCVLRYFNVAGADPAGRSGQSTIGATHLIKVAVEAALGKREAVSIFGTDFDTPDGTGVRDYIHVVDLAVAHVLALEALIAEPTQSLTLNCGYGHGFSVLEVLDTVDKITNNKLVRKPERRRDGDPASLIAEPSRLRETLKWKPQFDDLETIVTHALRWEQRLLERENGPSSRAGELPRLTPDWSRRSAT